MNAQGPTSAVVFQRPLDGLRCNEQDAAEQHQEHLFRRDVILPFSRRLKVIALTNHRKAIGKGSTIYAEQGRALETQVLTRVMSNHSIDQKKYPPVCLAMLLGILPRSIVMEAEGFGISLGHAEMSTLIERYLQLTETPARKSPSRKVVTRSARKSIGRTLR